MAARRRTALFAGTAPFAFCALLCVRLAVSARARSPSGEPKERNDMPIAFRAVTTLAQAASTTVTLTVPAGVVSGDLLLAVLHVGGGTGTTITPPAGWELVLRTNDGTSEATAVYRRRYLADTPAAHTWTITSAACV